MSDPSQNKPDLDDNTNVLVNASAVKRENSVLKDGTEPISLWVMLGSTLIVLVAGGALFSSSLFDYSELTESGYTRELQPSDGSAGMLPIPAHKAYDKIGGKLAKASCLACHGSNGEGAGAVPPLAGSSWVTGPSMRTAMIILNGLEGPITVAGKSYNGNMPAQGSGLGPKELAGIMNFVRRNFGNEAEFITKEMAQIALDTSKKRDGGQMSVAELDASYNVDIEGAEFDPNTLVDPKTLEPADLEEAPVH